MPSSILTGSNLYGRSVTVGINAAFKDSASASSSLSSGIKSNLGAVDKYIASGLNVQKSTFSTINNNVAKRKSQLQVMDHSLAKMKEALDDMHKTLLSAEGKNAKHLPNLENVMESYTELFNKHLEEAQFDKEYLLGALNFAHDVRVDEKLDQTCNVKVEALSPVIGSKKVKECFDIASAGGAKDLQDFGIDNLAKLGSGIYSSIVAIVGEDPSSVGPNARSVVITLAKNLGADAGFALHPLRKQVCQALGASFDTGGPKATWGNLRFEGYDGDNSRGDVLHGAIEVVTDTITKAIGSGDLSDAVISIVRLFSTDNTKDVGVVYNSMLSVVNRMADTPILKAVKATLAKGKDFVLGKHPTTDTDIALNNHLIKATIECALEAALDAAIKSSTDLVIDHLYAGKQKDIATKLHNVVRTAAGAGDADRTVSDLRATIDSIRFNPNAGKDRGTGVFKDKDEFEDLKDLVKAGPAVIEKALIAASAVHCAIRGTGDANDAVKAVSNIRMTSASKIRKTEAFIANIKTQISAKQSQVRNYMETLDSISKSIDQRIGVLANAYDALAKADIVATSQDFVDGMQKLKSSFEVLNSGQTIARKIIEHVKGTLTTTQR